MSIPLRIFLIAAILIFLLIILHMLRKKNLNLKYTLLWLAAAVIMLLIALFPGLIYSLSDLLGVALPVNAVFTISGMFSLMIMLSLTLIVSHLKNEIRDLTQSIAILEHDAKENRAEKTASEEPGNN